MYQFIKSMYDRHLMTAAQVWALVDKEPPTLTAAEAMRICGPRRKSA